MKTYLSTALFLTLCCAISGLQAQERSKSTGVTFIHPYVQPTYAQISPSSVEPEHRAPGEKLHAKLGGVFVDLTRYGANLINPFAPAKFGYGEKYAALPDGSITVHISGAPTGVRTITGIDAPGGERESGGIKVFTIEF